MMFYSCKRCAGESFLRKLGKNEMEVVDLKEFVDDDYDDAWKEAKEWFHLVALNIEWLQGKIGGSHPISFDRMETLDTDAEWTEFLIDVTRGFVGITISSQMGTCLEGLQERPYVTVLVEASIAALILDLVMIHRTQLDIATLFYSENSYEIITPTSTASRTRNGAKYNAFDTSCMDMVNGEYTFVLTREDGIATTHFPDPKHVGPNVKQDLENFTSLDMDPSGFVEITFAALKYGDRQNFMRCIMKIISCQVD